jgi:hypothetical protein
VIGLAATLTFGIFFAAWRSTGSKQRIGTAALVGVVTFFLTAVGGSTFRSAHLPSYRAVYVIGISLVAALALAGVVLLSRKWWSLLPLVLLAAGVTATVSPWQIGFADLRDGQAAQRVDALVADAATERGPQRWATDDIFTDALLMANAVPTVSGQQWAGPDRSSWEILDPDDEEEETWNRAAAYINFAWGPSGSAPTIELGSTDVIVVTIDPCGTAADRLDLEYVVSRTRLARRCLVQQHGFTFGGAERHVYRRAG